MPIIATVAQDGYEGSGYRRDSTSVCEGKGFAFTPPAEMFQSMQLLNCLSKPSVPLEMTCQESPALRRPSVANAAWAAEDPANVPGFFALTVPPSESTTSPSDLSDQRLRTDSDDSILSGRSYVHVKLPEVTDAKEYERIFLEVDTDKDGFVTASDLGILLCKFGRKLTSTELSDMVNDISLDGSGRIALADFVVLASQQVGNTEEESELREAFDLLDVDGNGRVGVAELRYAFRLMGETLTLEQADQLIDAYDFDKDRHLNYYEFARLMMADCDSFLL